MKKTMSVTIATLIVLSIFAIPVFSVSEPPPVEWDRTYGGAEHDLADHVVQTSDGGYVLAGYTGSFGAGSFDFWLGKTDASGLMEWNKTYGGADKDEARYIIKTTDDGYALVGNTESFGAGGTDFWLVKTDASGSMQWNKTYGGTEDDDCHYITQTSDGGYALMGGTWSFGAGSTDFWLVKTNSTGNMEWNQTYGGTNEDYGYSVTEAGDDGYALAGYTTSYGVGNSDFWFVVTDELGNPQWNGTYGGTDDDRCYSMVKTSDGGYALAGYTTSEGAGGRDFWLVKTDSSGSMDWNKTYGGVGDDNAHSIEQTDDGGFIIAGATTSFGIGDWSFWVVKTDSAGNMQWNLTYGETNEDIANAVIQTCDGGYCVAGQTGSWPYGNLAMVKIAPDREPTKWAVVIGVDEYTDPEQNSRGGPGHSAKDMYDVLVDYMGFSSDHVHLLVDEVGVIDDTVTGTAVERELKWLQCVAIPEDIVVFYYAGHGAQDSDTGHESIVTHTMEYIQDDEFATEIKKIRSENLCVVLDICYSGGFIKDGQTFREGLRGVGGEWSDLADETPSRRVVLAACAENIWHPRLRGAREWVFWHGYLPRYEMVFTHYLVQAFEGDGDSDNDGKVTVEEAFTYVRNNWVVLLLQTPMIYDGYPEYEGEGELYLGD